MTLDSYRCAWAERAKTVGYPEPFAQGALGHNSNAMHRGYAKRALMKIPSLEDYEKKLAAASAVILPLQGAIQARRRSQKIAPRFYAGHFSLIGNSRTPKPGDQRQASGHAMIV